MPKDAPGQTKSVFPMPLTIPVREDFTLLPTEALKSTPLWKPLAYAVFEKSVFPNFWVIYTLSNGQFRIPLPADGILFGSIANFNSDSNCANSLSNASFKATLSAKIFL